jgi:hypothetical protein
VISSRLNQSDNSDLTEKSLRSCCCISRAAQLSVIGEFAIFGSEHCTC